MAELVSAYPTSGGIYWWASKLGGAKAGYYTGWLNLIGLLAIVASVAYGCATFFDLTLGFFDSSYHSGSLDRIFLYFVVDPGDRRGGQHLLQPPARRHQQHLGVVARVRRGRGRADPDLPAPPPRQRVRRCSPTRSTTPASSGAGPSGFGFIFYVLPLSALLTQYTITGYDASAHLSEETKSAANTAAKGMWRSIFYSGIGGWILLLSFLFAVQNQGKVTSGGGGVAVDLRPGAHLPLGRHGAADLDRGPVLLHHGLHDQLHPDAVRLQP